MRMIVRLIAAAVLAAAIAAPSNAEVYVRGYQRRDGTYVRPHVRSTPNAYRSDNYGYDGGARLNRSYYAPTQNYRSDWYQPAPLTDENYYRGRRLYEQGGVSDRLWTRDSYEPSSYRWDDGYGY